MSLLAPVINWFIINFFNKNSTNSSITTKIMSDSKSSPTPTEEAFSIRIITPQEIKRVIQFLDQHFLGSEPLNHSLDGEKTEESGFTYRESTLLDNVKEGFSLLAVTSANEIVGVAINRNHPENIEYQSNQTYVHPNFSKIKKLIHVLEEQMADTANLHNTGKKEMLVRTIGVHPAWTNRGIAYALLKQSRDIAQQNSFDQIRAYCTSAYSARLFEKLGFHCVHAIKYEDYEENGDVVFKPAPPHTHVKAMISKI